MPLIEIPTLGKDVPITFTMPEAIVNDLHLYARFLRSSHESAPSAIAAECIRRTLKLDAEFQSWKSTHSKRGGSRPRPAQPGKPDPPKQP